MRVVLLFTLWLLAVGRSIDPDTPSKPRHLFQSDDSPNSPRRLAAAAAGGGAPLHTIPLIPSIHLGTDASLREYYTPYTPVAVEKKTSDSYDPDSPGHLVPFVAHKDGNVHYHVIYPSDFTQTPVTAILVQCYPWVSDKQATLSKATRKLSEDSMGPYWASQGYLFYELYTQPLHIIKDKENIVTTVKDVATFMYHLKTQTPDIRGSKVFVPDTVDISKLKIFFYGASAGGYLSMLVATFDRYITAHDRTQFSASEYIDGFIADAPWGHPDWDANVLTGQGRNRQAAKKLGRDAASPESLWFFDTQPDWHTYHRILPINNLIHLKKPILLIHNLFDDNVLVQRSLDFISEALNAKKEEQHVHLLVHALLYRTDLKSWKAGDHNYAAFPNDGPVYYAAMHKFMDDIKRGQYIAAEHFTTQSAQHKRALDKIEKLSHLLYRALHPNEYVRYPLNECVYHILSEFEYGRSMDPYWAMHNIEPCKPVLVFFRELASHHLPIRRLERQQFDDKMNFFKDYLEKHKRKDMIASVLGDPDMKRQFEAYYQSLMHMCATHGIGQQEMRSHYLVV